MISHPLSLAGGGLAFFSFFSILGMFLIEAILGKANPYIGVFTYMIYPGLLVLGLILLPIGVALGRRRRARTGEVPPYPRIDLNEARTRGVLALLTAVTVFILALISAVSYRAYQFTDSVGFCGELCHAVMKPEYTAYQSSPHSRVGCVECHVGPGATWFVRSKLSGAYQVYSVLFNKFPRPVATPISNLRPAQETCEHCHWPEKFFGAQLKVVTRYGYDEKNSVRQIRMLMRTGGGSPTTGATAGIHWHMNIANEVRYKATDRQRQEIPWVWVKDAQGRVTEYVDKGISLKPEELGKLEIRRMDCMDCHNRPSHVFRDPDGAVDNALLTQLVNSTLPYVKREAVRALSQNYLSTEEAREGIATSLDSFFLTRYPLLYNQKREVVKRAIGEVQRIYQTNFFPEMKVDWRTHPDNIGHTLYPGCFRCHEGKHVSKDGKVIRRDCQICHTIIGQETQVPTPTEVEMAETFTHPWQLKEKHAQLSCHQCHLMGRGLEGECAACHVRPAQAPMLFPCKQCHLQDQSLRPVADCAPCHATRGGLHTASTHSVAECISCHLPHEWKVTKREVCLSCHQDKETHNPDGPCQGCHQFR